MRIANDHARARIDHGLDGDRFRFSRGNHAVNGRPHDLGGTDRLDVKAHLTTLDPGDVQQILDQLRLGLGGAEDCAHALFNSALECSAGEQRVAPEQDRVEGVAQFVGDYRQKIRFRLICLLGIVKRRRKYVARSSNFSPRCRRQSNDQDQCGDWDAPQRDAILQISP